MKMYEEKKKLMKSWFLRKWGRGGTSIIRSWSWATVFTNKLKITTTRGVAR
jgi:hypothetical protein